MDRRDVLTTGTALIVATTAGCSTGSSKLGRTSPTGEKQDSDGDGVPDSEDYAPRDPEVQVESDAKQKTSSETPEYKWGLPSCSTGEFIFQITGVEVDSSDDVLYLSVKNLTARAVGVSKLNVRVETTQGRKLYAEKYVDGEIQGGGSQSYFVEYHELQDSDGYRLGTDEWEVTGIAISPDPIDIDEEDYTFSTCY